MTAKSVSKEEKSPKIDFRANKKIVLTALVLIALLIVIFLILRNVGKSNIVAKIGDKAITTDTLMEQYQKALSINPAITPEEVLNQTIMINIIQQEIINKNIAVTDDEIEEQLLQISGGNLDMLQQNLEQQKITLDDYKKTVKQFLEIQKLLADITKKIIITEADARDFYEKNKALLITTDQINASHILTATEDEANKIAEELIAGKDFNRLAFEKSTDPSAKINYGNLGFFSRNQMVPEFDQAAFSLKEGEISKPVKTDFGYHIIKVHEIRKGKQLELDEVKDDLKQAILNEKRKTAATRYISSLWDKANIKIFYEKLDQLKPKKQII